MGVDWMSIALTQDPNSFAVWHMLRDWIEGVKLAAEINSEDEMLLAKTIIDAMPDGIVLKHQVTTAVPDTIQLFHETDFMDRKIATSRACWILSYENDSLAPDQILQFPPEKIFLQAFWTAGKLKELLEIGYDGGICFMGGEEDKTGVRDYERMDELLGVLLQ